jgi:hypothetical protein
MRSYPPLRWKPLTQLSLRLSTRIAIGVASAALAVLGGSSMLGRMESRPGIEQERPLTVHAAEKSTRIVHLQDGHDLQTTYSKDARAAESVQKSLGNPLALASADFDEDGVPDLVCGYSGGKLALYRGNVDAIYPNSREAQQRKARGQFTEEAFFARRTTPGHSGVARRCRSGRLQCGRTQRHPDRGSKQQRGLFVVRHWTRRVSSSETD